MPASDAPSPISHPRLFVTPADAERLRRLVQGPRGTHHREAFDRMLARVAAGPGDETAYDGKPGYRRSAHAREAAFAHVVTGEVRFAELAFRTLDASLAGEDRPDDGYGLSRAMMCLGWALAYDWCHAAWSPAQRAAALAVMKRAADAWSAYSHPNLETEHRGSNWVGGCRGGELILHLSARGDGDYGDRSGRIARCVDDLRRHVATAYGRESGWTQEGLAYLQYTFGFLAPAALATRGTPYEALWKEFSRLPWLRLALHGFSFRANQNILQSGVDGESVYREGFASLVAPTVPPPDRGVYRHWYDRHLGVRAVNPVYDDHRAATVWALLLYPEDARPEEPPARLRGPLIDREKGIVYFRDRWKDADDVLVSLVARADHHGNAWSQPESLQLCLMGLDATWGTGPGKGREPELYSRPLVDGVIGKDGKERMDRGRVLEAAGDGRGGGRVVVEAGGNLGIALARRDLTVEFGARGLSALLTVRDRFVGSRGDAPASMPAAPHSYVWQMRPGAGVTVEAGADGKTFLMRKAGSDAYLKGWVTQSPPGTTVDAGDAAVPRARVVTPRLSGAVELSVTLALGRGRPPAEPPRA